MAWPLQSTKSYVKPHSGKSQAHVPDTNPSTYTSYLFTMLFQLASTSYTKFMEKNKKGLVLRTIERCYSLGRQISASTPTPPKNKLWRRSKSTGRHQVARDGCFTVCVGPDKMRFLIKTECVNHMLFKILLNEAEMEYGFASNGPLELPCDVELFQRVMWEMEQEMLSSPTWCSFPKAYGRYQLMSPGRLIVAGNF